MEDTGEVTLSFPADSVVMNKDGWDRVYPELHKLQFDYDKAAIGSLGSKARFKKAMRHQMKVLFFVA